MAEIKTKATDSDVLEFINKIEDNNQKQDSIYLLELLSEITKKEPQLWGNGTIGFGTFVYKSKSGQQGTWYLTGFAPRKGQISISIMAGFEQFAEILQNLGKHKLGVGCLYIKKLDDVDKTTLKKLVEQAFKHMSEKYK